MAIIGDPCLCDEVPKTDKALCNDVRKLLEGTGYCRITRGSGGKATRYEWSDINVNAMLDRRDMLRQARKEERNRRRKITRAVNVTRRRGIVAPTPPVAGVANGLPNDVQAEANGLLSTVSYLPPIHLQGTPTVSFPEDDRTPVYSTPDLSEEEYPEPLRLAVIPSKGPEAQRARASAQLLESPRSWTAPESLPATRDSDEAEHQLVLLLGRGDFERGLALAHDWPQFGAVAQMLTWQGLPGHEIAAVLRQNEALVLQAAE